MRPLLVVPLGVAGLAVLAAGCGSAARAVEDPSAVRADTRVPCSALGGCRRRHDGVASSPAELHADGAQLRPRVAENAL